jgi:hypothetical protein
VEGGADAQQTFQFSCRQGDEVPDIDNFPLHNQILDSSAADGSVEAPFDKATKEQQQTSSKSSLTTNLIKLEFSHCYVSFS